MGKLFLLVLVVAVVIYLVTRLIEKRGRLFGGGSNARLNAPPRPRGPIGPDDDPEFLRDLNRRQRRSRKKDDRPES